MMGLAFSALSDCSKATPGHFVVQGIDVRHWRPINVKS